MHYLDNLLDITGPSLALAISPSDLIFKLWAYLSVPMAYEKVVGPSNNLLFIEIELNTITQSSYLPDNKVEDIGLSLNGIPITNLLHTRALRKKSYFPHSLVRYYLREWESYQKFSLMASLQ